MPPGGPSQPAHDRWRRPEPQTSGGTQYEFETPRHMVAVRIRAPACCRGGARHAVVEVARPTTDASVSRPRTPGELQGTTLVIHAPSQVAVRRADAGTVRVPLAALRRALRVGRSRIMRGGGARGRSPAVGNVRISQGTVRPVTTASGDVLIEYVGGEMGSTAPRHMTGRRRGRDAARAQRRARQDPAGGAGPDCVRHIGCCARARRGTGAGARPASHRLVLPARVSTWTSARSPAAHKRPRVAHTAGEREGRDRRRPGEHGAAT